MKLSPARCGCVAGGGGGSAAARAGRLTRPGAASAGRSGSRLPALAARFPSFLSASCAPCPRWGWRTRTGLSAWPPPASARRSTRAHGPPPRSTSEGRRPPPRRYRGHGREGLWGTRGRGRPPEAAPESRALSALPRHRTGPPWGTRDTDTHGGHLTDGPGQRRSFNELGAPRRLHSRYKEWPCPARGTGWDRSADRELRSMNWVHRGCWQQRIQGGGRCWRWGFCVGTVNSLLRS